MKRDIDHFHVRDEHAAIHRRLENWARWATPRMAYAQGPIWRLGKSNSRQWHAPELRESTDPLDALKVERAVYALPDKERFAVRWSYVWKFSPAKACRMCAVSQEGLLELVSRGRTMLVNRL